MIHLADVWKVGYIFRPSVVDSLIQSNTFQSLNCRNRFAFGNFTPAFTKYHKYGT